MIQAITQVFTDIGTWITTQMTSMLTLFYANDELTLLGVLAVAGLGVAFVLLIINLVKDFMRFR